MTRIVALYGAYDGEAVFDVRIDGGKRITVADGTDLLTGRIGGLSGYVDAYICWTDEEPVKRVPVWSVTAIYEKE